MPGPCLGDYPHIGADANGIYLTTNEFDLAGPFFRGAQIYAISKRALTSRAPPSPWSSSTRGDDADSPVSGFTVWPATSPGDGDGDDDGGRGTEFLLSSDAVFNSPSVSTDLIVWSLANTRSLDSASPAPVLNVSAVAVAPVRRSAQGRSEGRGPPAARLRRRRDLPPQCHRQAGNPVNPAARLDSNDSRMQQVTFARRHALGRARHRRSIGGRHQAGIAYFVVNPRYGKLSTRATSRSRRNNDLSGDRGHRERPRRDRVHPVGADTSPVPLSPVWTRGAGAGPVARGGRGAGPQDGFTGYRPSRGRSRPRWGDYGAAASDGKSVWVASEYIGQTCTFAQYNPEPFGTCGGTRARWAIGTRESRRSCLATTTTTEPQAIRTSRAAKAAHAARRSAFPDGPMGSSSTGENAIARGSL